MPGKPNGRNRLFRLTETTEPPTGGPDIFAVLFLKNFPSHSLWDKNRELVLYGFIGLTGATLDFLLYSLLTTGFDVTPYIATIFSVSLGIVNNFVWNAFYNFKTRNKIWLRFLSFYLIGSFGVVLSAAGIFVLTELLAVGPIWAKIITIPIVVGIQFVLNKFITFRKRKQVGT